MIAQSFAEWSFIFRTLFSLVYGYGWIGILFMDPNTSQFDWFSLLAFSSVVCYIWREMQSWRFATKCWRLMCYIEFAVHTIQIRIVIIENLPRDIGTFAAIACNFGARSILFRCCCCFRVLRSNLFAHLVVSSIFIKVIFKLYHLHFYTIHCKPTYYGWTHNINGAYIES